MRADDTTTLCFVPEASSARLLVALHDEFLPCLAASVKCARRLESRIEGLGYVPAPARHVGNDVDEQFFGTGVAS